MALPHNRDSFAEHCLRKLGHPVIEINVDEDQVLDRIDEAIYFYQKYHYEALERVMYFHALTTEDIANGYLTLPAEIESVIKATTSGGGIFSNNFMSNIWQGMKNIMYDIGFGMGGCRSGTRDYSLMMMSLANLKWTFSVRNELNFNHVTRRLLIPAKTGEISEMAEGEIMAFEAYRIVDPDAFTGFWQTYVLIEYATALIGRQWGVNLSKYDGVMLPGGITLDGDKIYDRYNEIKISMEETYSDQYELPVDFFVG